MTRPEHIGADALALPISLPPHPPEPGPAGFPVLAVIAPVAGALVLFAVTGSAFSLAFAALGPLVAVASVFDARRQARRARRRGTIDRAAQLESVRGEVAERHAALRAEAWRRSPSARQLATLSVVPEWRDEGPGSVVIGRGSVASGVRVDGAPFDSDDRAVLERAARLDHAPVLAAVDRGIGIIGPPPLARAVARALLVQLAHRCRPDVVQLSVPSDAAWEWTEALPHRHGGGSRLVRITEVGGTRDLPADIPRRHRAPSSGLATPSATIAIAGSSSQLPSGLGTVLTVESHDRAVADPLAGETRDAVLVPELFGASEASAWAARIHVAALRDGFVGAAALPAQLDLDELVQPEHEPRSRAALRVAVGVHDGGVLEIDLVGGGPHAIVAGTTGSGKSEFLLAWLAALALCHPPSRVAFLLVDFKGGAAFEPIRRLPHVTGIVTDLDAAEAERAVSSLRAELRHRETVLRTERARDIVELDPDVELARLVIVIDEFQAMIERFPDLGAVIADIAARGRSLGVHLILASQRPNGVVREQVTANCPIRVSLRVMQRADSIAVVGTEAAASIRADLPGRGIVDVGEGMPVVFHSARADARSLEHLHRVGADTPHARRPWVDALPLVVSSAALDRATASARLEPGAVALGLVDEPERQRHGVFAWSPGDGHLLIAGAPGSGRSTALAAVARAAARQEQHTPLVRLEGTASAQWDVLVTAQRNLAERPTPVLLLIDDLDVRFRDWPDEYRHAALMAIDAILRDGRRAGVTVVATAGQPHRMGHGIREAFGALLLLRHASRTDLMQAGGVGALWRDQDPPGSGQWRGLRVQLVEVPQLPVEPSSPSPQLEIGAEGLWAVVSEAPRADAALLRDLGLAPLMLEPFDSLVGAALARHSREFGDASGMTEPCVIVGDADAWTANWAVAAQVREEATLVVHGGPREYRALAGGGLPPLLDDVATQCWTRRTGEATARAGWPPTRTTETVAAPGQTVRKPHEVRPESNGSDMIA